MSLVQLYGVQSLSRRRSALFLAAIAFLLTFPVAARCQPKIGAPAPALAVTTPDGRPLDLSTMKGRVVLVNFWATWCAPCMQEMPIIEKFYRKHHDSGFEVIAVSIDSPGARQRVAKVLGGLSFSGGLAANASHNGFGLPQYVPISYVIDANGVLRKMFDADIEMTDLNEEVLPLLKEASVKIEKPTEASAKLERPREAQIKPAPQDSGQTALSNVPNHVAVVLTLRALVRQPEGMKGEAERLAAYIDTGNALITQGNVDDGIKTFENCKSTAEQLLKQQPENPRWLLELAFCNEGIGNIRRTIPDYKGAEEAYGARKRIIERLAAIDPDNGSWQRELAISHAYLAYVYWQEGQQDKSRAALLSGKAIFERALQRSPGNASWKKELSWFDSVIPAVAGTRLDTRAFGPNAFPKPHRPVASIISPMWDDPHNRDQSKEVPQVVRLLGIEPGMTVADIGAGMGYYAVRLSPIIGNSGQIFAEDVMPAYVQGLQAKLRTLHLDNVTVTLGEPHDPKLPPASLDRALLVHMYHEVAQPFALLYNLAPALKPGAKIGIIDTTNKTAEHGTPPPLLRCELESMGYRQLAFHKLESDVYLAIFEMPEGSGPTPPGDVKPCNQQ